MKEAIFPYYEELLGEFEKEHGATGLGPSPWWADR